MPAPQKSSLFAPSIVLALALGAALVSVYVAALRLIQVLGDPARAAAAPLTPAELALPMGILLAGALLLGAAASWFLVARRRAAPADASPAEQEAAAEESPPATEAGTLSLLHILQREGRLIDFLREEIGAFSDEQVGAAVRAIHGDCQRALAEHLTIEPVMAHREGEAVVIEDGFDPSAIRLTGNLSGKGPHRGVLKHHGWRVILSQVPERPASQDARVLAPAEVEID